VLRRNNYLSCSVIMCIEHRTAAFNSTVHMQSNHAPLDALPLDYVPADTLHVYPFSSALPSTSISDCS
jgi:hypothetical protein